MAIIRGVACSNTCGPPFFHTGTMRDMRSYGVASMHTGLPLWVLAQTASLVPKEFQGSDFSKGVPQLIQVRGAR